MKTQPTYRTGRWEVALLAAIAIALLVFSARAFADGEGPLGLFLLTWSLIALFTPFSRLNRLFERMAPAVWLAGGVSFVVAGVLSLKADDTLLAIISITGGVVIALAAVAWLLIVRAETSTSASDGDGRTV